jgi:GH25 family lysozyme M1 (1,4-beta-N-acetylmuramidase)
MATLKGCDVSQFQSTINWDQLKTVVDFAIIRSSYGNGYTDPQFATNRDNSRRVGLLRGFYHYAYPQYNSPQTEAQWFAQVVGVPQSGEILALDFEEPFANPVPWCKSFLDALSTARNGYKPLIYMNESLANAHDWSSVINAGYKLWLALWDFNANTSSFSVPWSSGEIAIHQWTDKTTLTGISGNVDGDTFFGDSVVFQANGYAPITPPPPGGTMVVMPTYLQGLFQAQGLDWNNESATRAFWQRAIDWLSDQSTIASLQSNVTALSAAQTQQQATIDGLQQNIATLTKQLNDINIKPNLPPVPAPPPTVVIIPTNPIARFFFDLLTGYPKQ